MLCIINYGSGNVAAIANICRREKIDFYVASRPCELMSGTHFLLPGVGAFDPTMDTLQSSGLLVALEDQVIGENKPILGICIGMHLLADASDEGRRPGLGWIPGRVRRIDASQLNSPPHLPHMGWNSLDVRRSHEMLSGIDSETGFYFLHSYFFDVSYEENILATVSYGADLPCVVQKGKIIGAQFHPEKSHLNGIRLLKNFSGLV